MENIFWSASGALTTESYSDMLMQIVDTSKNPLTLRGWGAKYNDCGAKARAELLRRGWTITDEGEQDGGVDIDRCTKWNPPNP